MPLLYPKFKLLECMIELEQYLLGIFSIRYSQLLVTKNRALEEIMNFLNAQLKW